MGWGQAAMESHRLRLERAGMVERLKLRQGQEALVWATGPGARAAGVGVSPLRRAPAPTTWEHHLAVGWAAAFFTVRRRAMLGSREEIGWSEQAGYRRSRHRPDLVAAGAEGHTLAVEVELTAKSRSRTRAVLDMYARSRVIDRVVYVVADELLMRHINRCRERSVLESERVVVARLSELRQQTLSWPSERFCAPAPVPYAVRVTEDEIETQKRVERHQVALRRQREQEERQAAEQREQHSAAQQQPPHPPTADAQATTDELLAELAGDQTSPRKRSGMH